MDRLIYTAVSGMSASMVRQRMIASNMANAQTIGFRAEVLEARPVTLDGPSLEVRAMNRSEVRGALMKDGVVIETGRELDIAMQGDVMLAVQEMDGSEVYTRRGDLSISATGLLQNGDNLPVLGANGPITVPLGTRISIAPDGAIMATDPAAPDQPPVEVDRLKLVSTTGSDVRKALTGRFRVPEGGVLPMDANARIVVGSLEQSNVNSAEVLVEMVEAQRLFEIRTKVVSTARELDEGGAKLMNLNG